MTPNFNRWNSSECYSFTLLYTTGLSVPNEKMFSSTSTSGVADIHSKEFSLILRPSISYSQSANCFAYISHRTKPDNSLLFSLDKI